MCGRTHFKINSNKQSFNHCPTELQPILTQLPAEAQATLKKSISNSTILQAICDNTVEERWGIKLGHLVINCRDDTESALFKLLLDSNRIIIPAIGYYEWLRERGPPKPFYFSLKPELVKDANDLASKQLWLAGIQGRDGYATLTTAASPEINEIHDRMPVILSAEECVDWLDKSKKFSSVKHLIASKCCLQYYPVSSSVNDARRKDPSCIDQVSFQKQSKINFTPSKPSARAPLKSASKDTPEVQKVEELSEEDQLKLALERSLKDQDQTPQTKKRKFNDFTSSSQGDFQDGEHSDYESEEPKKSSTKPSSSSKPKPKKTPSKITPSKTPKKMDKNQLSIKSFFSSLNHS